MSRDPHLVVETPKITQDHCQAVGISLLGKKKIIQQKTLLEEREEED